MPSSRSPRIAIMASGSGTTAEAVIHATQTNVLPARIGMVITNNPNVGVIARVDRLNEQYGLRIAVHHISGRTHPGDPGMQGEQTLEEADAIAALCANVDLVAMLGYMKKVRGAALDLPLVNSHPGPLPETAGLFGVHVQEHVLALGLHYSAHTVHRVDGDYDHGDIIIAHSVPVVEGDTAAELSAAVQATEKALLPVDLAWILRNDMMRPA